MDIWEEIDNLKQRVYTAYDTISSVGGNVSELSDLTTYNLSSTIEDLATPVQDDWRVPYKWPDLREVLKNDPFKNRSGVQGRCVVLTDVFENGLPGVRGANVGSTLTWGWFNIYSYCQNSIGWRTSNDPDTFVAVEKTDVQYQWDASKYIEGPDGRKFVWIEIYYNRPYAHFGWSSGYAVVNSTWPGLVWMCGDGTHGCLIYARFARRLEAVTGFTYIGVQQYLFEFAAQLKTIPPLSCSSLTYNPISFASSAGLKKITWAEGGMPLSATNYLYFLYNATKIEDFPDVLFEGNLITCVNNIASNAASITRYPSVMDFSKVKTNLANFWNYSNYLRQYIDKMPDKMIFPDTLTLSCLINPMGTVNIDEYCRFDEDGHLSGGWLYGWTRNPGYTTDLSVKFQTANSWMTAEQKAEISSYLLTKGFYVYNI